MKSRLTPNQRKFCDEWLIDHNGTRAYRAAYPRVQRDETAAPAANRLLRNGKVGAYIKKRQTEAAEKYRISQDRVLEEEASIAFFDPRELFGEDGRLLEVGKMPERVARAVQSFKVKQVVDGPGAPPATITEIKLWDKGRSLERVSRHLGLYEKDNLQRRPTIEEAFAAVATVSPGAAEALKGALLKIIERDRG